MRKLCLWATLSVGLPLGCAGEAATQNQEDALVHAYSIVNAPAIEYDCRQSVVCHIERGASYGADPVGDCIQVSSMLLDAVGEDGRDGFEGSYLRCAHMMGCFYYDCAIADPLAGQASL